MLEKPTVEVIVTSYNDGRFLDEAVASAVDLAQAAQAEATVSYLIADDGSTERRTVEIHLVDWRKSVRAGSPATAPVVGSSETLISPCRNTAMPSSVAATVPKPGTALCLLAEIPDEGAKEVVFGEGYDCFHRRYLNNILPSQET